MAQPLSLHPTSEGAAADAAPILPFSCMTGASKDVLRHIQQGALSAKAKYFLTMIAIASFGTAGWQKQQHLPNPGVSCLFDLSAWAGEHGWSRQYTWRIREQVVALGILFYEPDPIHPQQGTLRWNLEFTQWQVLDDTYRQQRYIRLGAGRPRKTEEADQPKSNVLQSAGKSNVLQQRTPTQVLPSEPLFKRLHDSEQTQPKSNALHQAGKSNGLQKQSNVLQPTCAEEIKRVTPARIETTQEAAPDLALRKELRKKERITEPSNDGSDAQDASTEIVMAQNNHIKKANGSSSSTSSLASSRETVPSSFWPPRHEWEKTDLDYYQRVVREHENQRVALLTRLAYERIGVPLITTSYARIGALAKHCGVALLVKHILLAAANHIDGDPLDYLSKLVHSSQAGHPRKKEASYGSALNTSSNNSNDRPKRFGWEGWDVATAR